MQAWHNRLPGPGFAVWPRVPRVLDGYPRVAVLGPPGSDFRNYYVILRVHYGTTGPCDSGFNNTTYSTINHNKAVLGSLYIYKPFPPLSDSPWFSFYDLIRTPLLLAVKNILCCHGALHHPWVFMSTPFISIRYQ
jgi:hypothetical protein